MADIVNETNNEQRAEKILQENPGFAEPYQRIKRLWENNNPGKPLSFLSDDEALAVAKAVKKAHGYDLHEDYLTFLKLSDGLKYESKKRTVPITYEEYNNNDQRSMADPMTYMYWESKKSKDGKIYRSNELHSGNKLDWDFIFKADSMYEVGQYFDKCYYMYSPKNKCFYSYKNYGRGSTQGVFKTFLDMLSYILDMDE